VWHGQRSRLHLEQWAFENRLIRRIIGDLDWFPSGATHTASGPPPPPLLQFAIDAEDRPWLRIRVPDADWNQRRLRGAEGLITDEQMGEFFDTRVDVFDLPSRRHLGWQQWDEPFVGFVVAGSRMLLQLVKYDAQTIPRVVLYTVEVQP